MERKIEEFYLKWKKDKNKRPLIIYGGKQVGKTFSTLEFGKKEYLMKNEILYDEDMLEVSTPLLDGATDNFIISLNDKFIEIECDNFWYWHKMMLWSHIDY